MVALVTLTHSVRVRILFPLPNEKHTLCVLFFLHMQGFEASGSEFRAGGTKEPRTGFSAEKESCSRCQKAYLGCAFFVEICIILLPFLILHIFTKYVKIIYKGVTLV